MTSPRQYESTHGWITFDMGDLITNGLKQGSWLRLGESFSKCLFLLRAPIGPKKAVDLSQIYMRKGAWATAQIEGNTLSEEQLDAILDEDKQLPESQQYLKQEIENVMKVIKTIEEDVASQISANSALLPIFEISPSWIKGINAQLLEGLELEDHVVPGEFRDVLVGVKRYKGAPAEDLDYLMDKYCIWINELISGARRAEIDQGPAFGFAVIFLAATLAHLYFAWIHPFGDGNGRTARLIECAILAHSGLVPWISTNILSDYYNKTRGNYYQRLEDASVNGDVVGFVNYSIQGFLEQLRDQVDQVQLFHRKIAWISYIHERFNVVVESTKASRQKKLALHLDGEEFSSPKEILDNDMHLSLIYASLSEKTLKRDLNELVRLGLVEIANGRTYRANIRVMDGFKPLPELGSH